MTKNGWVEIIGVFLFVHLDKSDKQDQCKLWKNSSAMTLFVYTAVYGKLYKQVSNDEVHIFFYRVYFVQVMPTY